MNTTALALQPYDRDVALAYVDGDESLWREVATLALTGLVELVDKARRALEANEAPALARVAHTLKGLCGSLGAESTRMSALALEAAARGADGVARADAFAGVEARVRRLVSALETDLRGA